MFKRIFIPLLIVLVVVAAVLFYLFHTPKLIKSEKDTRLEITRTQLTNGMQVVIVPLKRVPAVTHMLVVKAGGADDAGELPGLAHFLEHLMFTGTEKYPQGAYDKTLTRLGAEHNAFTTYDYTAYYVTIAKEHLETVMQLESDRLQHLRFDDAKAAREKNVILEERQSRVDNQPAAQLSEQMRAIQYLAHPYGRPLIGWADTISRFTAKAAEDFYTRYYRASNMALVIVGDVDVAQAQKLIANYYGTLPTSPVPERIWAKEPTLPTTRTVTLHDARVQQKRLTLVFDAPSLGDGDIQAPTGDTIHAIFALEVLAQYLGAPETGVLYRKLVRDAALFTDISVSADGWNLGPGRFTIHASLRDNISVKQAESAIYQALANAEKSGIRDDLLVQAKTGLAAEAIYARDGFFRLASILAGLQALSQNEQLFYQWQEKIEAVQPTALLTLLSQFNQRKARVSGYLLPETSVRVPASKNPPIVPVAALTPQQAQGAK